MIIYNPMTRKEAMPLVLVMFTIICALPLPATVVSPPSAIAQEDDDEENLASGTVSNVLDSGSTAGDNTNTQLSIPITDQDQRDANLAAQLGLNVDIVEEEEEEVRPPECPSGFTLNDNNNGQCERTVTQAPECPEGFTFNPETDQCEQRQTQAPT
jgi:hypothetical protein